MAEKQVSMADNFPTLGISLKGIKTFIADHGGEETFTGLTVYMVSEKYAKPATKEFADSYCEVFKEVKGKSEINQATVFLSYFWDDDFLDVVAALEDWDKNQATPAMFWFSLFTNNQHRARTRDFSWYIDNFLDVIGKMGSALLVFKWDDPKPLSRAWCLWELLCTLPTKGEFHVSISPKDQAPFMKALQEDFVSVYAKICNMDVTKAIAFNPVALNKIMQAVETTFGFAEANRHLNGMMGEWMVKSGKEALRLLPEDERPNSLLATRLTALLKDQGRFDEVESLLKELGKGKRRNSSGDIQNKREKFGVADPK